MLNKKWIVAGLFVTGMYAHTMAQENDSTRVRTLLVFFDGLRPDYITADNMPNLYAFKQAGAYGKQHHSVFPTVTRVNAASYATGSYPASHGIMGNEVFFPAVKPLSPLSTGNANNLMQIDSAEQGKLLTSPSLGEILGAAGEKMMVFSSGSTGQAFLQNHKVNGAVINVEMILPASMKDAVTAAVGKVPGENELDNRARHVWATDALLHFGMAEDGPLVNAIWFSDPDGAAHSKGMGSLEAMRSIKSVDEQFGRILHYLEEKKLTPYYNIIVSADHGFVTYTGKEDVRSFLINQHLKQDKTSDDVVLADGAIYVKNHDAGLIQLIVTALQQQEWIGAIFTKGSQPGDMKGIVPGTLSFESIHWNHPQRTADILVDVNWNDNKNENGYAGMSFSEGVAGHGSISPYEIHIGLMVSGPSFKKHFQSDIPTCNVDLTPTILHIHHLPIPAKMDGRIMTELLTGSKGVLPKPVTQTIVAETKVNNIIYKLSLNKTIVGKNAYINYAHVVRRKVY